MRRSVPLLAAALVAMTCSVADASHGHRHHRRRVYSEPIAEAVWRAVVYWGGTPCGGIVSVTYGPDGEAPAAGANAPGAPGHVAAMWADWSTPGGGRNDFVQPPTTFTECTVHVNRSIWPSRQAEDSNFPAFCKEMLHEYGHFEGFPDVGQTLGTVEYERPDLAHVPLCERYRLQFGLRLFAGVPPAPQRTGERDR
jgi:hypothetical protein